MLLVFAQGFDDLQSCVCTRALRTCEGDLDVFAHDLAVGSASLVGRVSLDDVAATQVVAISGATLDYAETARKDSGVVCAEVLRRSVVVFFEYQTGTLVVQLRCQRHLERFSNRGSISFVLDIWLGASLMRKD